MGSISLLNGVQMAHGPQRFVLQLSATSESGLITTKAVLIEPEFELPIPGIVVDGTTRAQWNMDRDFIAGRFASASELNDFSDGIAVSWTPWTVRSGTSTGIVYSVSLWRLPTPNEMADGTNTTRLNSTDVSQQQYGWYHQVLPWTVTGHSQSYNIAT